MHTTDLLHYLAARYTESAGSLSDDQQAMLAGFAQILQNNAPTSVEYGVEGLALRLQDNTIVTITTPREVRPGNDSSAWPVTQPKPDQGGIDHRNSYWFGINKPDN